MNFVLSSQEPAQTQETPAEYPDSQTHSNLGLLLFNDSLEMIYMNPEAQRMLDFLRSSHKGALSPEELPPDLLSFADTLLDVFHHERESSSNVHQLRRITGPAQYPIRLHGFFFPPDSSILPNRFLIILEKLFSEREKKLSERTLFPKRYGLTKRQKALVPYITAGWTNKQIAAELGISVYTVKEHIKHIMRKTQTTTRTGAIARLTRRRQPKSRPETCRNSSNGIEQQLASFALHSSGQ